MRAADDLRVLVDAAEIHGARSESLARLFVLAPDMAALLADALDALAAWTGDGTNHEDYCRVDGEGRGCDCFTAVADELIARAEELTRERDETA